MRLLLRLSLAAYLIGFYACTTCSKKIDCPGFNDTELTKWFPYVDNQRLIFQSNNNTIDTFTLHNTETTEPYQVMSGGFNPNRGCQAIKRFESYEKDQNKQSLFYISLESYTSNDSVIMKEVNLALGPDQIIIHQLHDTGFQSVTILGSLTNQKQFPAIQMGGQIFTNVRAAFRDTLQNKNSGISEIYFSKNSGIVAFKMYPSLTTWVKK